MFEKLVFDVSPHNTIRLWAYFDEARFHVLEKSNLKIAFDYFSCWGGWDKRETGCVSWEFPVALAEYFYVRYSTSAADVEYLRKYLGK